jgi:hypothetical protein
MIDESTLLSLLVGSIHRSYLDRQLQHSHFIGMRYVRGVTAGRP